MSDLDDELSRKLGTPRTMLIVSDLHLGQGRDRRTSRFNPRENFLTAEDFQRLLEYHAPAPDEQSLLVLNGDTFDFLRIVTTPRSLEDFRAWKDALQLLGISKTDQDLAVPKHERTYGLRTQDYKCIWKLLCIEQGHPAFFGALRFWVREGGSLVIVKGNHDLELHWPLVHRHLRLIIGGDDSGAAQRIHFCDTGYRIANVYVEHGHRFERTTAVRGPAVLPNGTEINYPPGSMVNRYLVNRLEGMEPFLDNIKPLSMLLRTLARKHPIELLRVAHHCAPILARALRRFWLRETFALAAFFAAFLLPIITGATIIAYLLVPPFAHWIGTALPATARKIMSVGGLLAPYIGGIIHDLIRKRKPPAGEDDYAAGIYEVLQTIAPAARYRRYYGVIGHTHVADIQYLPPIGNAEAWYLNTGTWIPNWREDRPDLMGHIIRSFVNFSFENGEYHHQSLEWTLQAEPEAPSVILEPPSVAETG